MNPIEEKYRQAELGRLYLVYKCEDLEREISELKAKVHEMGHKMEEISREKEYWQNIAAK